eukprot:354661-Chlamydomonas_euryale.AAC.1
MALGRPARVLVATLIAPVSTTWCAPILLRGPGLKDLAASARQGALLSSSDVERVCENPTVDTDVRKFELGCRVGK